LVRVLVFTSADSFADRRSGRQAASGD
jgi:hypothetical protein